MRVDVRQCRIPQTDFPAVRFVEPQQQLHQCRLSATACPHNGRNLPLGHGQAHILQHIVAFRPVVAEAHMLHPYILSFGQFAQLGGDALLLILPSVNLVQPLQADFRILQLPAEADERTDGSVQLPDDVRQRHHHPQGHFPFHHCLGCEERNHDVRRLAEEYRTHLLNLSQCHALHAYLEQLYLYAFPLPTFLPFAVVQLYFLHPRNQLYQTALLARSLGKTTDVQLPTVFHEHQHPRDVQRISE